MLITWSCNSIFHTQDEFFTCSNLTHKTETGIAKGGRLLIATPLEQSDHLANQQQMNIKLCCCAFCQPEHAGPNWHVLTFLHSKFAIEYTSGVAAPSSQWVFFFPWMDLQSSLQQIWGNTFHHQRKPLLHASSHHQRRRRRRHPASVRQRSLHGKLAPIEQELGSKLAVQRH